MHIRHYSGCTQSAGYWDEWLDSDVEPLHALAHAAHGNSDHMVGFVDDSGRILFHAGAHTDWHVVLGAPPQN